MSSMPDSEADQSLTGSITMLYQVWRRGETGALSELIERFRPRLLALAHSTLAGRLVRFADAEDAMQSAIVSFWERVESGGFDDDLDRNDLWNVLGVMTVRKALKLKARENAQKRGGGLAAAAFPVEELGGGGAQPGLDLLCSEMLEMLAPELRSYALLRLMGYKNREIASEFGCTERKVERKLQLVRAEWEQEAARWQA